jgi:hypothetical protein
MYLSSYALNVMGLTIMEQSNGAHDIGRVKAMLLSDLSTLTG